MTNEPGFTVTLKDVYEEMRDLTSEVRTLTSELKESRKTDEDHERRLRIVERWMWGLPVAFLTAVGGLLMALLK
jgi:signal transduction histidine kinase